MRKSFYPKLAASNIRKNQAAYLPYLLTCIFTVALFYIMRSLSLNPGILAMAGGDTIRSAMELGCWVTGFFSTVFLFYTSSFLMRRRKMEFGLFHILGMEKRHISRLIGLETLYMGAISLVAGLFLGIVLDKAMYLLIIKVLGSGVGLGFYISAEAIWNTLLLYSGVFLLILLYSLWQLGNAKPVELLQSKRAGEREPKTKRVMAVLGTICLAAGYFISVTSGDPAAAITQFFIAVMLVIIATYFLFTAGSIALLKLLRRNKKYYYRTEHFTTVSGMLYRMKQNAVGLANICILSTMALVMLSATISMMIGVNDMVNARYPYDLSVTVFGQGETDETHRLDADLRGMIDQGGLSVTDEMTFSYLELNARQKGNAFLTDGGDVLGDGERWSCLYFIPLADYNRISGENKTLAEGQILLYSIRNDFSYDTLQVCGRTYRVAGRLDGFSGSDALTGNVISAQFIVMKDLNAIESIALPEEGGKTALASQKINTFIGYDMTGSKEQQITLYHGFPQQLAPKNYHVALESKAANRDSFVALYGGYFFLSIFLGLLFLMATTLIIYYKQISEGYDDRERFEIMRKVGMSGQEIKRTVHSQIITVFFLPLIMAGLHVAFAFPIILNILQALKLPSTTLYAACTVGCFLAFALLYAAIYGVTAKAYYRIVSRKGRGW